jgi:colanic acid/amylovoran biosynthesis glycosyltransferase
MHSFVVIASKTDRPVDPLLLARIDDPDPAELHFVPEDYRTWSNASGTIHFFGWQAFTDLHGIGSHWHADDEGLTAFTGHVWPRYSGWDWYGAPWAQQLAGYFAHADIPESSEDLYGIYTAVSLPVDGKGYVVSDRFSLGILYIAETPDVLIVSSRASLAARAVTPAGMTPQRDAFGVAWLSATIQTRTLDTGFVDVKAIPPMGHVLLDPVDGARVVEADRWYWEFPNQDEIPHTIEALRPMLEDDLRKEMRALIELPASMRQIRLSGGKDSRLLTALTLQEGVADQFEFMTFGLPGSGETEVAEMIAKRFDLNWVFEDRSDRDIEELDRMILTHVFQMAGVRSAWDMKGSVTIGDTLTLSGNMSEFIRMGPAAGATRFAVTRSEAWDELIAGQHVDSMHFLRKDQREIFIDRIYSWMTDLLERGETLDRLSTHMFPEFIARWQYGAGTEANGKLWSFPFYTPTAVRAAQQLPPSQRVNHRFHFEIMQHAHEDLVRIPFFKDPWREYAYNHLPNAGDYAAIEAILSEDYTIDWRVAKFNENHDLFEQFLLDSSNPIYEVLDFNRIAGLLHRRVGSHGAVRYLYSALTAAIWMAHGELNARINRNGNLVVSESPTSAIPSISADDGRMAASSIDDELAVYRNGRQYEGLDSRPRKILLVETNFPTRSQTFIVDKFLHLLIRGWDVRVLALIGYFATWESFPEIAAQPELVQRVESSTDFEEVLERLKPELVHFEFGQTSVEHLLTCRAHGVHTVVSFRGFDICYHGLETPGYYNDVWKYADVIHCRSEGIWQRCLQRGCPPDKPHEVIVGGIDTEFFDPGDRQHTDYTGTPERPLRMVSVGRLVWKKGHEYAVQALARLREQGIEAELRIVGGGAHEPAIRFAAFDLGVTDYVTLLGPRTRTEAREELLAADVFVMPSLSEGFGIAALEAQAMKLPVVCSDAEGLPENVQDMVSGFVVPRRTSELMAERLAMLAGDPEMRQLMGEAGRERVSHFFRVDQEIDAFERLYLETIDRRFQAHRLLSLMNETTPPAEPDVLTLIRLEAEFSSRATIL